MRTTADSFGNVSTELLEDESEGSVWEGFSSDGGAAVVEEEGGLDMHSMHDINAEPLSKETQNGQTGRSEYVQDDNLSPSPPPFASMAAIARPNARSNPRSSRKKGALPAATSTFLPSLMMSGYFSGSESGGDTGDAGNRPPQPRKNRRGQQARRALAEKKYGSKAKHLKGAARSSGWDPRKGATDTSASPGRWKERGSRTGTEGRRGSRAGSGDNPNTISVARRQKTKETRADAPLHPSWEAAKKAKELKRGALFQGKKVVFN
ncbi:MAG: hypothetical protein M1829_002824 [Trizodia sp. TS-e1964]|nr:MAG: hypothetical protein M1829_002824 [Trizodia sp. TS-e1964]